jgi:predicted Zn-dependent protease with MMP-like domain
MLLRSRPHASRNLEIQSTLIAKEFRPISPFPFAVHAKDRESLNVKGSSVVSAWHILVCFLGVAIFGFLISLDSKRWLRGSRRRAVHEMRDSQWKDLNARAEAVVQETIGKLPEELKGIAEALPCVMREWAAAHSTILGHYFSFDRGRLSESNGPIILCLGAIARYCEDTGASFEEQVRTTYLHEFGHHLGLDELELQERGLA